jgi:hypothetical protein
MSFMFNRKLRELTDEEQQLAESIKQKADDLYAMIDLIPGSREQESAKFRLEESVMWAMKAIARVDD